MRIRRALIAVFMAISLVTAPVMPVEAAQWISITQSVDGTDWGVWRTQYASTYDGDGCIAAKVRDVHTDGSCVQAVYHDGGRAYVQATSCYGWTNHLFWDQTGDSRSFVRLNRTNHADPWIWWQITGY